MCGLRENCAESVECVGIVCRVQGAWELCGECGVRGYCVGRENCVESVNVVWSVGWHILFILCSSHTQVMMKTASYDT